MLKRGVAQIGRALRSGRRGRGFESRHLDFLCAGITQLVEYLTRNEEAVGSSPISSLKKAQKQGIRYRKMVKHSIGSAFFMTGDDLITTYLI